VAIREAQKRRRERDLFALYGHSTLELWRAKTLNYYRSHLSQYIVAVVIVLGFVVDVAEAQLLPDEGSEGERVFLLLDIVITAFFTVEILVNLFASSADCFRIFCAQALILKKSVPGQIYCIKAYEEDFSECVPPPQTVSASSARRHSF